MAKKSKKQRNKASERRREREAQRKQQQRLQIIGGGVVVAIIVGALFFISSSGGIGAVTGAIPEVAQERLDLDPVMGNPDAPVTIVEYGAYGCHACREWHNAGIVEDILDEFGDSVNFVFRDFPVIVPAYDRMAANIAQCALDQSNDGYWRLHDAFYGIAHETDSFDRLIELGGDVGLNETALRECAEANTHVATVNYDLQRAQQIGARGTPTWMVNGQPYYSASPDVLRQAIQQALAS